MNQKTPRRMSPGAKLLIAAGLLLAAAAVQYFYFNGPALGETREWRFNDTQKGVAYDYDAGALFYSYDAKYYYFCTKDGMQYVSAAGDVKWQQIYSLSKPVLTAKGPTVAVGEGRGKHIYVYNESGPLFDKAFDQPVLDFSVNEAGYLSVILQLDQGYAVQVYNQQRNAEPLYSNFIHNELLLPTSVDVSEDGRYAAITMLDLNVRMNAYVSFYYMNTQDVGTQADSLRESYDFRDQFAYRVKFMDDNRILLFTDTQIVCFRLDEDNPDSMEWTLPLHNAIDRLAFYGGSRFAFVTGEKLLNDDEAVEPGELQIYSVTGEQTGTFTLGRKATYLSMGCDAVIVGADHSFYALRSNGSRLWEYISLQEVRDFLFLDNTDTVLMAGGINATVLKRVRVKASATPTDNPLEPGEWEQE